MLIAQVIGTVVATRKHDKLLGSKIQVVRPLDAAGGAPQGDPFVAIDAVGAGVGEKVIVVRGSGARYGLDTPDCPVDAVIVGIIDRIDVEDIRAD